MIALSAFGPDARAIVDVEAFGVMLHAPGERVQLVTRHRAGGAAHLLPRQRLPELLSPSIGAVTIVTPLSSHAEAFDPIVARLLAYNIECLLLMPLAGDLGLFWTGKRDASPFTAAEVLGFERLASRVAAAIQEPETRDARIARLARTDAVEQVLPLITGALDVRDVFHRLSDVARSVLPHDAATVWLLDEDHARARVYALNGIPWANVPEEFSTNYAAVFNEHFQFSIHDDLLANPAERERPTA